MDWVALFESSRRFYRDHQLPEWHDALPDAPTEGLDADPGVQTALRLGFRAGFVLPPFPVQMATLERLIEETARKKAPSLPDNQQYSGEVFLADTWTKTPNGKILQRTVDLGGREEHPYLLLYDPNPVAKAWGRTGQQIADYFQEKYWNGLTVPEYFLLQRARAEQWGDQRFFDVPQEGQPVHWLWLIDSLMDGACSVVLTGSRGVNVQACPVGNREARRAAIATMVFPLEAAD